MVSGATVGVERSVPVVALWCVSLAVWLLSKRDAGERLAGGRLGPFERA